MTTKILVCGGRDFDDWHLLNQTMLDQTLGQDSVTIIQGGAKGADFLAKVWVKYRQKEFYCFLEKEYPADWRKHGKAAGYIRNKQMLEEGEPDLVIAFPGGRGTEDMIRQAEKANIKVKRITYDS